jgi:serine protease Do
MTFRNNRGTAALSRMTENRDVPKTPRPAGARRPVILLSAGAAIGVLAFAAGSTRSDLRDWLGPATAQNVSRTANPRPAGAIADFSDVVERVKPAVIGLRAEVETQPAEHPPLTPGSPADKLFREFGHPKDLKDKPDTPRRPRVSTSVGSGFFISADGYAVTTNHLIERVKSIEVTTDDGISRPAKVVGVDAKTDLALLKVEGGGQDFPFVELADKAPRIGEWVLAVGNPFGLGGTVTAGIVSARARDIKLGTYNDFIQIDAPVNQGNSGGPTFDINGKVIGVNSAIFSPTGSSVGIGFAIPAETVRSVIAQLKEKGTVVRGRVGVQIQAITPEIAEALGLDRPQGALVVEPEPDSPAARAGIQPGDVITSINGTPTKGDHELLKTIGDMAPGTTVTLGLRRRAEDSTITVTLDQAPVEPTQKTAAAGDRKPPPVASNDPSNLGLTLAQIPAEAGPGVMVADVDPDGTAADRGLEVGDVILDVGGALVKTPADVERSLNDAQKQGKRVAVMRVKSGTTTRFVTLPLG